MVLCCLQFSERVLTDSFVHNELDDPEDLVTLHRQDMPRKLEGWQDIATLKLLNLGRCHAGRSWSILMRLCCCFPTLANARPPRHSV